MCLPQSAAAAFGISAGLLCVVGPARRSASVGSVPTLAPTAERVTIAEGQEPGSPTAALLQPWRHKMPPVPVDAVAAAQSPVAPTEVLEMISSGPIGATHAQDQISLCPELFFHPLRASLKIRDHRPTGRSRC